MLPVLASHNVLRVEDQVDAKDEHAYEANDKVEGWPEEEAQEEECEEDKMLFATSCCPDEINRDLDEEVRMSSETKVLKRSNNGILRLVRIESEYVKCLGNTLDQHTTRIIKGQVG